MEKKRVIENEGVLGELNAEQYDKLQRELRDRGHLSTDAIISSGISSGMTLEIGPGPGYLGLEWLKKTENTVLKAIEISPDMIKLATKNAIGYALANRVEYILGRGQQLPFKNKTFDAVFTNGSLHEWTNPEQVFDEIYRVLKTGGKFFISDLRRDIDSETVEKLKHMVPKERWDGLISSINSSYTPNEVNEILHKSKLSQITLLKNTFSLEITGRK